MDADEINTSSDNILSGSDSSITSMGSDLSKSGGSSVSGDSSGDSGGDSSSGTASSSRNGDNTTSAVSGTTGINNDVSARQSTSRDADATAAAAENLDRTVATIPSSSSSSLSLSGERRNIEHNLQQIYLVDQPCSVCLEIIHDLAQINECKHTFCLACLKTLIGMATLGLPKCPLCRVTFRTLYYKMESETEVKSMQVAHQQPHSILAVATAGHPITIVWDEITAEIIAELFYNLTFFLTGIDVTATTSDHVQLVTTNWYRLLRHRVARHEFSLMASARPPPVVDWIRNRILVNNRQVTTQVRWNLSFLQTARGQEVTFNHISLMVSIQDRLSGSTTCMSSMVNGQSLIVVVEPIPRTYPRRYAIFIRPQLQSITHRRRFEQIISIANCVGNAIGLRGNRSIFSVARRYLKGLINGDSGDNIKARYYYRKLKRAIVRTRQHAAMNIVNDGRFYVVDGYGEIYVDYGDYGSSAAAGRQSYDFEGGADGDEGGEDVMITSSDEHVKREIFEAIYHGIANMAITAGAGNGGGGSYEDMESFRAIYNGICNVGIIDGCGGGAAAGAGAAAGETNDKIVITEINDDIDDIPASAATTATIDDKID